MISERGKATRTQGDGNDVEQGNNCSQICDLKISLEAGAETSFPEVLPTRRAENCFATHSPRSHGGAVPFTSPTLLTFPPCSLRRNKSPRRTECWNAIKLPKITVSETGSGTGFELANRLPGFGTARSKSVPWQLSSSFMMRL